ncbi:MAG: single-stranded DNA-binding protein [Lautropia sp.]
MASDLNCTHLIGRLGRDPETRYTESGNAVASFSIAVGSQWTDKNTNEKVEHTDWINCTAFGKLAEICEKYLKKGKQVYVGGRLRVEKYQDKDSGKDRWSTKVIVDRMQLLADPGARDGENRSTETRTPSQSRASSAQGSAPTGYAPSSGFDAMDDDIPFANPYRGSRALVV